MTQDGRASKRKRGAQGIRRALVMGPFVNMVALTVCYRK